MKKIIRDVLSCCCLILFLGSCAAGPGGKEVQAPLTPLSCIAVPPAGNMVDNNETISYDQAKTLEKGASLATSVLNRELAGNSNVRIISQSQMATLLPEISGGLAGSVSLLGERVHCDGVLLTTVRKFDQREGTEYAADSPASAEMKMVLIHAPTKRVLWSAEYRETQESFLSNILSFDKVQSRGFKWITVEKMLDDGIVERLNQCPYLK